MKFKLTANTEIDLLTKDEMQEVIQDQSSTLTNILTGGVRYRPVSQKFTGSGPISFSFTPNSGYTWAVRAVSVQKAGPGGVLVYMDQIQPLSFVNLITDDGANNNFATYPAGSLVITPTGALIVQAQSQTGVAYCRLGVKECRAGEEWRL